MPIKACLRPPAGACRDRSGRRRFTEHGERRRKTGDRAGQLRRSSADAATVCTLTEPCSEAEATVLAWRCISSAEFDMDWAVARIYPVALLYSASLAVISCLRSQVRATAHRRRTHDCMIRHVACAAELEREPDRFVATNRLDRSFFTPDKRPSWATLQVE
jgi:hypothetical protein